MPINHCNRIFMQYKIQVSKVIKETFDTVINTK